MIDSGASTDFMSMEFVRRWGICTTKKQRPYTLYSASSQTLGPNNGDVDTETVMVQLKVGMHQIPITFDIVDTGTRIDLILGSSWLQESEVTINFKRQTMDFRKGLLA